MTGSRPTRDQMLMKIAEAYAERGTCDRLKVGAVASSMGRALVGGYNGTPRGMPHCIHTILDGPCTLAVHAEANAVAYAAMNGVALLGCELHVTHMPCYTCATLIINSGIRRVVYAKPYRLTDGIDLLQRAGVEVAHLNFGTIGWSHDEPAIDSQS